MGESKALNNRIKTDINNITESERAEAALQLGINELEQRVAERTEALKKSEALLFEMATQVPGVVYQFYARPNGEMGFYYISDRSERVLGLKPDLGGYFERFTALVIPEHREGFIKSIEKAVKESSEWKYEGILQKPTGEKICFSGNSTPTPRENEIVFNGIVTDITERKKAEEELAAVKLQQKAILDNIPDIAWLKDTESRFIIVNAPFGKSCGVKPEDLVGKTDLDIWPSELAERYRVDDRDVMATGRRISVEEPLADKEGKTLYIETIKSPVYDTAGKIAGTVGIARDITERKQAESQREAAFGALRESERKLKELVDKTTRSQEELKASYTELKMSKDDLVRSEKLAYTGRIAASIAHEIRNPLTNVSMSVRQLKRDGRIKPEGFKHSEIIERNVERINFLITELLNCARPAKFNPQPYDIHQVIEDALIADKGKIRLQKIKVVKNLIAKPSILKIDKEHMGRALLNLITNAVDALPRGGNLTISTEINKDFLLIKVEDTGKGIPEKDIIRIFDPFFSTKPQGVGLGLTTCYGIIVSHGGTIEVESKWRKGTIFIVSLPIAER